MQQTSNDYKQLIRAINKPYDEVYGTITFSDDSTMNIEPSIIPNGSLNIVRQCTSSNSIEYGDVSSDILEMSLLTDKSRYAFYDANIVLDYRIWINNAWEVVHLGVFTITDADRPADDRVKFTAYDPMRKLDKGLPADAISGTPFEVLEFISEYCDYPLAFDEQFIEDNFTNINTNIYLDSTSGIKTCRDAVKVVCQNLGCCARDNRQGSLELYDHHTEVDITLTTNAWEANNIADYTCNFVGLTVTSAKGTFSSISSTEDVGNIMQIPDAPAWDYGVLAELQLMTDRLFDKLNDIVYTPCEIDALSDPSFDCGDRLALVTSSGDTVETIITSYEWKWHGGMEISSKGINPYEQGVSTSDIASTRLLNKESAQSKFTYYTYTNAGVVTLTTSFQRLYRIRFTVGDTTTVTLWHELKMLNTLASENQVITLNYYLDGIKFDREPVHTYGESGYHTLGNQYYLQDVEAGEAHEWEVRAKINSGSAVVDRGDLIAVIQGQNLAPSDKFNGEITIEEEFTPITLHRSIVPLSENLPDTLVRDPDPDEHDYDYQTEWGYYDGEEKYLVFRKPLEVDCADTFTPIALHRRIVALSENMNLTAQAVQYTRITVELEDGVEVNNTRITEDGGTRLTEV